MIMMNSVLTSEERCMLQSLGCKDKAQALSVLGEMKMILPIRSDLFAQVVRLSEKLEKEKIDYAYEMSEIGLSDEEIA
ncbi:MAG: hypothetical protein J6A37_00155 [Oscillospiraceae bacterium]|nr:hypothetical protein [Oscillospiraceae bacterium]